MHWQLADSGGRPGPSSVIIMLHSARAPPAGCTPTHWHHHDATPGLAQLAKGSCQWSEANSDTDWPGQSGHHPSPALPVTQARRQPGLCGPGAGGGPMHAGPRARRPQCRTGRWHWHRAPAQAPPAAARGPCAAAPRGARALSVRTLITNYIVLPYCWFSSQLPLHQP
jgi:hypothetical protein